MPDTIEPSETSEVASEHHTSALVFGSKIRNSLVNLAAHAGFGITSFREPRRKPEMQGVMHLKGKREMLLTPVEAWQLIALIKSTEKLGGSMAEIGVYRGASARLIREADQERTLHLFDTFEGLPATREDDVHFRGAFQKGQMACSLQSVSDYLRGLPAVHFHKGLFPDSAAGVRDQRFSFVHSDVDLYESTRSVVEFFYPRMLRGGIIATHDFATAYGPFQAFQEFFSDKPDPVIELPGNQAIVVKL